MKYTGTIIGLKSSFGSIYNIVVDDNKCYAWKGNVVAEFKDKMLTITFNWNGESFELRLSLLKEGYYTGKIIFNSEEGGHVLLWSYNQKDRMILKGDFEEEDAGNYDCFIELKPLKV